MAFKCHDKCVLQELHYKGIKLCWLDPTQQQQDIDCITNDVYNPPLWRIARSMLLVIKLPQLSGRWAPEKEKESHRHH